MKHRLDLTIPQTYKMLYALENHKGQDPEMDDLAAEIRRNMQFLAEGETVTLVIRRTKDELHPNDHDRERVR